MREFPSKMLLSFQIQHLFCKVGEVCPMSNGEVLEVSATVANLRDCVDPLN